MLLQPRKFKFKNRQKGRSVKVWSDKKLSYGNMGLKLTQALLISGKRIFRMKIFLKRAARKGDRTSRFMWFLAFPHIPLTRKGKGSRMGKGSGKLSAWFVHLKPGVVLVEFKHLRPGRAFYYIAQTSHKLAMRTSKLVTSLGRMRLNNVAKANSMALSFN